MSLGAFAQGFAGGMNMGRQWKKWDEEDQLKQLQAEEFGKVGQSANYGEAMGLAEGQQAEMLKAQDAEFGDAGYKATAEGLNSVSADTTRADPAKMRAVTERDATEGYLRRAQAKGLMTPMEAMKMRGEAMDYEGKRLGLKAAQRADESQDRQAKYAAEAAKGLEMIDSGPENALKYGIQMFNSDQGRWGQGEFKGVRVTGAVREDGNIVLYDEKDGTKNMVISPAELRTEVRRAHMEKVALENPQVAMQLLDRDLRKAEKAGDREHAIEVLNLGHELGMIKQAAYLKGLERVAAKGSGGRAGGDLTESEAGAINTYNDLRLRAQQARAAGKSAEADALELQANGALKGVRQTTLLRIREAATSGAKASKPLTIDNAPKAAQKEHEMLMGIPATKAMEGKSWFSSDWEDYNKAVKAFRLKYPDFAHTVPLAKPDGSLEFNPMAGVERQDGMIASGGNQGGAKPQSQGLRGGMDESSSHLKGPAVRLGARGQELLDGMNFDLNEASAAALQKRREDFERIRAERAKEKELRRAMAVRHD